MSETGTEVFAKYLNIKMSTALGYQNTVSQLECISMKLAAEVFTATRIEYHSEQLRHDICTHRGMYTQLRNCAVDQRTQRYTRKRRTRRTGSDAVGPEPIVTLAYQWSRAIQTQRYKTSHSIT